MIIKRSKSLVTSCITDKSRIILPSITLLCVIMVLVGVFLPWFHISKSVWGFTLSYSASGWEMALHNSLLLKTFTYYSDRTFPQAYFMLGGSIFLIAVSICAFVIPLVKKEWLKIAGIVQSIAAAIAALFSFSIAMWFLAYIILLRNYLTDSGISVNSLGYGYGFYISTSFSFLALIVGIATTVKAFRQPRHNSKNDGLIVSATEDLSDER